MKKIITLNLIIILCTELSFAKIIYVASSDGNDSYSGLYSSYISGSDGPLKTITHALTHVTRYAGDTIYIRTGTYNERFTIYLKDGAEDAYTLISNYNNETVVIDGAGITNGAGNGLIHIYGQYIRLNGLEVINSDQTAIYTTSTSSYPTSHHRIISNCLVHDIRGAAIGLGGDYDIAEYCTAYDIALMNENGTMSIGWPAGISARRYPNYAIIRHCTIYDCWGEGISTFEATNTIIEDNIIYDCYSVGLYISDATDCIVQRNFIYGTKDMPHLSGIARMVGLGYWNEKYVEPYVNNRNIIINNIVYNCDKNFRTGNATIIDNGTIISNNTFINSTLVTCVEIGYAVHTGGIFSNNLIIQEDALSCIISSSNGSLTYSNNFYNKAYDADAVGSNDVTSTVHISKVGTYTDTTYYQLLSNSDAVDGGVNIDTVKVDYIGVARDATTDIGALEYVAPETPVTGIVLTTVQPYWTSNVTATSGGNIVDDGGGTVSARGICWNTTGTPTTSDSKTEDGSGVGAYSSSMTGLTRSETYYIRAYGTNEAGTFYGDEYTFRASQMLQKSGKALKDKDGKLLIID